MGEPPLVVRQPRAVGVRMPQMQHAGREGAVLAPHAGMQQPDQQIGILLAPAAEARVEAIDPVEIGAPDREIAGARAFPGLRPQSSATARAAGAAPAPAD